MVGLWYGPFLAEDGVIPRCARHFCPLWVAALVGVFNDCAETDFSVFVLDAAENPFAGFIHLNDDVGPLCRSEENRLDFARRGDRLPSSVTTLSL